MAHPHKHKAKSKPKRQSILRRLASDNRVKGLFVVLFILLTGIGIFATQQRQVYKSEASAPSRAACAALCARCGLPLTSCTVAGCIADCLTSGGGGGGGGGSSSNNNPPTYTSLAHNSTCYKELRGNCFNPDTYRCVSPGRILSSGPAGCPRTSSNEPSKCCYLHGSGSGHAQVVRKSSGSGSSSNGPSGGAECRRSADCPQGQSCSGFSNTSLGHCVSSGGGGTDTCTPAGGKCYNPAEQRCGPASDPGQRNSTKTCKNGKKCCSKAAVAAGFPKGKSSGGGGASTDPSTPSQFDDGGLGGNNQMGTGVTANNGGGSSGSPAGKSSANCSVSQKPSSITPSGTVKPGEKTLRWSAVSKVTKYKVTVNSTARDVTGTSMPLTVKDKKTYNIKVQAYICGKEGNAKTATIKGDVNKGGTPTGGACKAEGTQCGLHGGSNPGSQCCSKVCIDNKCAAVGTPTEEPTEEPIASIEASLKISLRFQGLNSTSSKKFLSEKTRVTLVHTPSNTVFEPKTVDFRIVNALRWEGEARFAGVASGSGYLVAIKGPQHVQRLICDAQPADSLGSSTNDLYICERDEDDHQIGGITLGRGANILDFDGITQFAGDLPDQDGVIDSLDLANVRQSLGSTESDALEVADLNLDGVVNTADFSLVIQGLERYRADENYTGVQLEEE